MKNPFAPLRICSFYLTILLFIMIGSMQQSQAQITIVVDDLIGKTHKPPPLFNSFSLTKSTTSPRGSGSGALITKVTVVNSKNATVYTQNIPNLPSATIPAMAAGRYMVAVETTHGIFHVEIEMP